MNLRHVAWFCVIEGKTWATRESIELIKNRIHVGN